MKNPGRRVSRDGASVAPMFYTCRLGGRGQCSGFHGCWLASWRRKRPQPYETVIRRVTLSRDRTRLPWQRWSHIGFVREFSIQSDLYITMGLVEIFSYSYRRVSLWTAK